MLKIAGGTHRGRKLLSVPSDRTRPTAQRVREALFSIIGPREVERVLDCFAGSGAIGLEALSRGAGRVVAIEKDPRAAGIVAQNAAMLGYSDRVAVVAQDALKALVRLAQPGGAPAERFDLLFADPPYAFTAWSELLAALCAVAAPGALVVVEHSSEDSLLEVTGLVPRRTYRYGGSALSTFDVG